MASGRQTRPTGFRLQLEEVVVALELVCGKGGVALASTEFGRSLLSESQTAIRRARDAAAGDSESAMRDCAFELALIEQKLASLLS